MDGDVAALGRDEERARTVIDPHESTNAAGAPPPPGADSPVPSDAAARAAAAGRAKQRAARVAAGRDELVPSTAIENRARDRERARRARLGVGGTPLPQVANPGVGMPGQLLPPGFAPAVAESMPQRFVPAGWQVQNPTAGMPFGGAPIVQQAPPPSPAYAHPVPVAPLYAPVRQGPWPNGTVPYGAGPYGAATAGATPYGAAPRGPVQYGMPQYPPLPPTQPPRVPWTPVQRRTALLSAWLGQTVMALATHLLTAFFLIAAFALLLHSSGDAGDFDADSFTAIIARWTMPDRVWASALIGLLVGGGILAAGWLLQALWGRSAGLAKPHRSTWLAWLCTTAATGLIGMLVWPAALIGGFVIVLASDQSSLTTGSMWQVLFWELGVAIVLTGGVGLLFGWLFWSQARPRVDYRALAEAEEAAARAADEAELTEVRLRGEASMRPTAAPEPGSAQR